MNFSSSRVPHLARAIAEKRRIKSVVLRLATSDFEVSPRAHTASRSFNTKTACFQRPDRHPVASRNPSRPTDPPLRRPLNRSIPAGVQEETTRTDGDYTPSNDTKTVSRYLMAVSAFAVVMGGYITYFWMSYSQAVEQYNQRDDKLPQSADVSDRWKDTKRNFDYEVESSEKAMFLKAKRRRLIREAFGDVLEVSVGTGRNMDLYDTRPYSAVEDASYGRSRKHMITSLTFNDQSEVMVENAKKKWIDQQKEKNGKDRFRGPVKFVQGDAGLSGIIPRPEGGYDTVVQSMGVCSMADPVNFLKHLGRLARQPGESIENAAPAKFREQEDDGKGGRIFLLEHGRGYSRWSWLNQYLDNSAAMHADRYGCWYNKDIGEVIKESGLVVEREKRYYFGTVWEIVLRPALVPLPDKDIKLSKATTTTVAAQDKTAKKAGLFSSFWR